ncbi:hypothetical protein ABIB27_003769 [Arthrobacter sp. UYEF21]
MAIAVMAASQPLAPRGSTTLVAMRILPGSVSITDSILPTQGPFALAVVKSAVLSARWWRWEWTQEPQLSG